MARFFGRVGYGEPIEGMPGVWTDNIVERQYFGDVIRNARNLRQGENLNPDLSVQNSISIVADAYANDHFFAIRYVEWAGALWTISSVEVQSPRLILRLGEVYNGPKAGDTPATHPLPPVDPPVGPTPVTPVAPTFDGTTVIVATTPGIVYKNGDTLEILTTDMPVVLAIGENITVRSYIESDDFVFSPEVTVLQWYFENVG